MSSEIFLSAAYNEPWHPPPLGDSESATPLTWPYTKFEKRYENDGMISKIYPSSLFMDINFFVRLNDIYFSRNINRMICLVVEKIWKQSENMNHCWF